MHSIEELRTYFEEALQITEFENEPVSLYEPIKYILNLGGKRVRPVCTLAACEMFGSRPSDAINQALAVEIFHNFTLAHDDIMDQAPLRRGKATMHTKWDENTAILSGDAMMILAYQYLQKASSDKIHELLSHFNSTAIRVCEGQQWDMEFEKRDDVSLPHYLEMIRDKTAVLLGESLRLGAIMADAPIEDAHLIYDFGRDFGIAFQLQDDLLDVYGNPDKFGKQVGGDIIEGKKTFLYLKTLQVASPDDKNELQKTYSDKQIDPNEKVDRVRVIFDRYNIRDLTRAEMNRYYISSGIAMNSIGVDDEHKEVLRSFAGSLMVRDF